jgi:hypothetical protein
MHWMMGYFAWGVQLNERIKQYTLREICSILLQVCYRLLGLDQALQDI